MRDDIDDYRIPWRLGDEPCEVYLFRTWGGYDHPVLPIDPLTLSEALRTPSLCRAFVREIAGEPLLVCLACSAAQTCEFRLTAPLAPGLYSVERAPNDTQVPGAPLALADAAMTDRLILVEPSEDPLKATLRELRWAYTYEYEYDAEHVLRAIFIINEQGRRAIP